MKITDKFVLFWGGVLSNFEYSDKPIVFRTIDPRFRHPNINALQSRNFPTSEHIFMFLKACYFKDYEVADKISEAATPKEAKALGRTVAGFSEEEWEKVRYEAMFSAIWHKVWYDKKYYDAITNPAWENLEFAEASPYDRIWGIGLSENTKEAEVKKMWKGLNLLGKAQCELRKYLKWYEWVTTRGLNEFHEDLIWCPSQIYYWFKDGEDIRVVYMRWRWSDPWEIELCKVRDPENLDSWNFDDAEIINLGRDYKDSEYMDMEKDLVDYLKNRFPGFTFPSEIVRKNPRAWEGTKII